MRKTEIKNDIKHYKNDTIMLNNRRLEIERLKDNIITVKELLDKIKGELKKKNLSKSRKKKLYSKLLKQKNNLKALNHLSSLLETQIKVKHTDNKENNPFDFSDIKFDNDEIDLGEYLNIVENNIVKFENDDIIKVLENVTDEYPFILKGELKINNNESSMINAFFSNRDGLIERIEKINERYDESIPITFTGLVIKYTKSFNKIRRSYYGTGCDSFKKIVEYRGNLCFIPEQNECFRKCIEFITKKDFSEQYRNFIKDSKRNKNIRTSARIQPSVKNITIISVFTI